jgi:hypothetical protein
VQYLLLPACTVAVPTYYIFCNALPPAFLIWNALPAAAIFFIHLLVFVLFNAAPATLNFYSAVLLLVFAVMLCPLLLFS